MLVLRRHSGPEVVHNDSDPCGYNEKEQLHLPAAIDWLDNAWV